MKQLPLFLALDVDTKDQALDFVQRSQSYVYGYKIGPRLFLKYGPELIEEIKSASSAKIFLDFKFYDIPSSTLEALRSAFHIGADYVTVHASAGPTALALLSQFEKEARQKKFFQILCVTILSSGADAKNISERVLELADEVYRADLRGLVCPPHEARGLRQKYPGLFLLTPGIRLRGDSTDDQKKAMDPLQALQAGSSALVMGRSLLKAKEPEKILQELACRFKKS